MACGARGTGGCEVRDTAQALLREALAGGPQPRRHRRVPRPQRRIAQGASGLQARAFAYARRRGSPVLLPHGSLRRKSSRGLCGMGCGGRGAAAGSGRE